MSNPWFFEDVPIDAAAVEALRTAALHAAAALEAAAGARLRSATTGLARCAGPFADDLADDLLRAAARDRALAEGCRHLAAQAAAAAGAGAADGVRRAALRDAYEAELSRDAARAAERATATGSGLIIGRPAAGSGLEAA